MLQKLLFLLPLAVAVLAQNNSNNGIATSPASYSFPTRYLSGYRPSLQPRPINSGSQIPVVSQPTLPPTMTVSYPYSPDQFSSPIPTVPGQTLTPGVIYEPKIVFVPKNVEPFSDPAVTPDQPASVSPQPAETAQTEIAPQPEVVTQPEPSRQPEVIVTPEPAQVQPAPSRQPDNVAEPEPSHQPEVIVSPEPAQDQDLPSRQPEVDPTPEPERQTEVIPQPQPTLPPVVIRQPQETPQPQPAIQPTTTQWYTPAPASVSQPNYSKAPGSQGTLLPLLPKQEPVREPVYGRPTHPTPTVYYPTPSYKTTYPPNQYTRPPQVVTRVPPTVVTRVPPQVVTRVPPQVVTRVPPTVAPTLPPQVVTRVPPTIVTRVPPQVVTRVPPQVVTRVPPTVAPTLPPQVVTRVPPTIVTRVPPQVVTRVPPQVVTRVPPTVAPTLPPQVVTRVPPTIVTRVPPQVVTRVPPTVAPTLPPQVVTRVPPTIVTRVPPQVVTRVPPQVVTRVPPQVVTRTPPTVVVVTPRPRPTGPFKTDFQCPESNGFYPVANSCVAYYECKGYIPVRGTCPSGLNFNPAAKYSEYSPCAYPSDVQCTAGNVIQRPTPPPNPTGQCPDAFGSFAINDGDCSRFIMCQEGVATIMNCPMGLVFNDQTRTCDWPVNVPQCTPSVFKDFSCPAPPVERNGEISDIIYKYRYGSQCRSFVACQKGRPRLLSCDPGLAFDETTQSCINEEFVTNCATPYSGAVV